jgi:para-nitrobenzyl esterase
VYGYLFTWKSPARRGTLGACHTLEIGFIFGNLDPKFCGSGPSVDRLSVQMQDSWLSFVKTGNPSCQSLGEWPQYGDKRKMMLFGPDSHVEEDPYPEERRIWNIIGDIKLQP